jgi:malic enzyme
MLAIVGRASDRQQERQQQQERMQQQKRKKQLEYQQYACTAKTLYRKFETNAPRKGIARLYSPNSYIHVSVND